MAVIYVYRSEVILGFARVDCGGGNGWLR
jgi:hypothetical protein